VIEFLKYLDQFGKTKVHATGCTFYGHPNPPAPCTCPLKQAWGSLDALIGRLRAAYEENGGAPDSNPFAARAVRIYLREVRDAHAKARGIPYEKIRKRKRGGNGGGSGSSSGAAAGGSSSSAAVAIPGEGSGGGASSWISSIHAIDLCLFSSILLFQWSSSILMDDLELNLSFVPLSHFLLLIC
jgi:Protein of unknown function (DUF640)